MKAHDIRLSFLDYFSRRGHRIVASSSLLPKDDPTLLFTNAGMNQFKNLFLGLEQRAYTRAVTVQKCLRVSGKHNDLEQVGRTSKHHTFFEMLGNFSFGDYFKLEAVSFAWELVTDVFRIPSERLYITVYEEDEEAYRLWNERVGVAAARIFRFGKKDNYWSMGDTGPCGPCSEIHYDLDGDIPAGEARGLIESGSERLVELWNLVFMQFEQDAEGRLRPLPSPSIDTGMGLERTAAALQGRRSNFETDLFLPLLERIAEETGREYPAEDEADVAMRVIADHLRAVTFLVSDGIMPANDGRGYVLRRLIRRAFRQGNLLGLDRPFLYKLTGAVGDVMKDAYPELLGTAAFVSKICLSEEERFAATLASGLRVFHDLAARAKTEGRTTLGGPEIFKLYDTLGFPLDLSQELAREEGLSLDEPGFQAELEKQKKRARETWKGDAAAKDRKVYEPFVGRGGRFEGYERQRLEGPRILGVLAEGRRVTSLGEGQRGEVILDRTPFYAEAGGQASDTGILKNPRFSARVEAASFPVPEVIAHRITVLSGSAAEGDEVEAAVDEDRRLALRRNHTATHLLHAALRQVLGEHVKQAGSLVLPGRLRFDFTHFAALSPEEIRKVESLVNEKIREDLPVETRTVTLEEGLCAGAMAIFEEKYGDRVRMVSISDFSRELCGGIHSASTGRLGLFKILKEESVAAGMRRIEAVTGDEAVSETQDAESLLEEIQAALSAPRRDLAAQARRLRDEVKEKEREIRLLRQKIARGQGSPAGEKTLSVKGVRLLTRKTEALDPGEIRGLADELKKKLGSGVVVIGQTEGEKVLLVVAVTEDLTAKIRADRLVKALAAEVGGGGGGRADFAQAGGRAPGKLDELLDRSAALLETWL
ncbi:MAG: alanine--tRNA ligase [Candidatus Aminicenantes bacterium]|nr:alanine--tRNA ligase [Candidatus Aminicenantes bacterium]